jgi:hypothetical protein
VRATRGKRSLKERALAFLRRAVFDRFGRG